MEALYPSLEAEKSGVLVREMTERSKIKIEVDERELKLYWASTPEEPEEDEVKVCRRTIREKINTSQGLQLRR